MAGRSVILVLGPEPSAKRFRVEAPSNYVRQRQSWILGQMGQLGGTAYLQTLE